MLKDITLMDEITEQDLAQVSGGNLILGYKAHLAVSKYVLGDNNGPICTISKECMDGCN